MHFLHTKLKLTSYDIGCGASHFVRLFLLLLFGFIHVAVLQMRSLAVGFLQVRPLLGQFSNSRGELLTIETVRDEATSVRGDSH